jgi:hypothetical protein
MPASLVLTRASLAAVTRSGSTLKARFRTFSDSLYARARQRAKCDHVWIFEARTLSRASPATMRDVRCIPDELNLRAGGPHVAPEAAADSPGPERCLFSQVVLGSDAAARVHVPANGSGAG